MDVDEIVRGLSLRAKRAIVRIGYDWTDEVEGGPARKDAYSLWWGRCHKFALVERPMLISDAYAGRWSWKLTETGLAVRARLLEQDHG